MWSDQESENDYLNFGEISQLAVDILTSPSMLPVSVGIFGNWGSGKSSLLKLIKKDLQNSNTDLLVINFDAWLYQGYDDARAALLEVIATKLDEAAKGNESLLKKTKCLLKRVNIFRVFGLMAEGAALMSGIPTGGVLSKGIDRLGNLTDGIQDKSEYDELVETSMKTREATDGLIRPETKLSPPQQIDAFRQEYGEILKTLDKQLIVIIDNLDRCLPTNSINTLEAIRLFLFLPNTAFIIAADEEMVRLAVGEYFKGSSRRHQIDYLDKLIQIPIRVPKAGVLEIRSYLFMLYAMERGVKGEQLEKLRAGLVSSLQQSWQEDPITKVEALKLTGMHKDQSLGCAFDLADRIAPILATSPIIHGNPRIVKRLLNVVKMRSQIAARRKIPLDESVITKLVIFERCAGADATATLYQLIDKEEGTPLIFGQLEESTTNEFPNNAPSTWKDILTTKEFILKWVKLEPPLKDRDLRAAIYLSREIMPVGAYIVGLSPKGREKLEVLIKVEHLSSQIGLETVKGLPLGERCLVMEGIIEHLRKRSDWIKQPKGFAGACLLARTSNEAARVFSRFIGGLGKQPHWMHAMLKTEDWYKEK